MKKTTFAISIFMLLLAGQALAQASPEKKEELTARQIIDKSQLAFYYQGEDMKAKIRMELIDKDGGRRIRVLTMLRIDEEDGGNQKYFMYFHEPGDVRRMTYMVWKDPVKDDDRWIFIPAVDLIRRISADDKHSSFVGSDFTYEDISGRDVASERHEIIRTEKLGDKECYVIQSIPGEGSVYTKRVSWIDTQIFLPLKEEFYDVQNELSRVFTADTIEEITVGQGEQAKVFPTVTRRTMKNVKTGHRTETGFDSVSYNTGLKDGDFSERRMRRPPGSWIR